MVCEMQSRFLYFLSKQDLIRAISTPHFIPALLQCRAKHLTASGKMTMNEEQNRFVIDYVHALIKIITDNGLDQWLDRCIELSNDNALLASITKLYADLRHANIANKHIKTIIELRELYLELPPLKNADSPDYPLGERSNGLPLGLDIKEPIPEKGELALLIDTIVVLHTSTSTSPHSISSSPTLFSPPSETFELPNIAIVFADKPISKHCEILTLGESQSLKASRFPKTHNEVIFKFCTFKGQEAYVATLGPSITKAHIILFFGEDATLLTQIRYMEHSAFAISYAEATITLTKIESLGTHVPQPVPQNSYDHLSTLITDHLLPKLPIALESAQSTQSVKKPGCGCALF